ncbi:hypothetical protein LCGC14_2567520, partial [marine sediment metagenome]
RKVGNKYRVKGFGERDVTVFVDRGDIVIAESGTRTKITGIIEEIAVVSDTGAVDVDKEIIPQTGVVIMRIRPRRERFR